MLTSHRFDQLFAKLKERNEGAFVPFATLCDPTPEISFEILKTMIESGADALELGIPFSDPCADGLVIQKANRRALNSGADTDKCFEVIAKIRALFEDTPISLLVYSNLVTARGIDKFYADAAAAGVDAILVPDIPVSFIDGPCNFKEAAQKSGVNTVLIAPPNADDETLQKIASTCQGYTYVLSRYGITGTDSVFGRHAEEFVKLKEFNSPCTLLGFGISTPEHVRDALALGADGAIVGSALVRDIEKHLDNKDQMLKVIAGHVQGYKAATLK